MDLFIGNTSLFTKDQSLMDLLEDRTREQNFLEKLSVPPSAKSAAFNSLPQQSQKPDQRPPPAYFRTLKLIKSPNGQMVQQKRPESQNISKKSSLITSPNNYNSINHTGSVQKASSSNNINNNNDTVQSSSQQQQQQHHLNSQQLPPTSQQQQQFFPSQTGSSYLYNNNNTGLQQGNSNNNNISTTSGTALAAAVGGMSSSSYYQHNNNNIYNTTSYLNNANNSKMNSNNSNGGDCVYLQQSLEQKERALALLTRKHQETRVELQMLKSREQQREPKSYFNCRVSESESPELAVEAINHVYQMCDLTMKALQQRVKLMCSMISTLDEVKQNGTLDKKDVFILKKGILDMANVAVEVSQNELDANFYYRQLKKVQLEYANLQITHERLQQRCELVEQNLRQAREKWKETDEENLCTHKNLRMLDQKYVESEKKVDSLNKRIDILKGQQIIKDKDKIKQILEDLLKENEHLKKDVFSREQYIIKLQMNINQLKDKNGRLLKKIRLLKNQQKKGGSEDQDQEEYTQNAGGYNNNNDEQENDDDQNNDNMLNKLNNNNKINADPYLSETQHQDLSVLAETEALRFLERNAFPANLHVVLDAHVRSEYASLLKDVQDSGTFLGIDAIVQARDAQEKINIITATTEMFRVTKTWLDDANYFAKCMVEMQELNSLEDVQVYAANNLRKLLECDSAHIWLVDSQLGCYYSLTENRTKLQAYLQHELFGDVTRFRQTIMLYPRREIRLYRNIDNDEVRVVDGAVLVPLVVTQERVEAFLEASQFYNSTTGGTNNIGNNGRASFSNNNSGVANPNNGMVNPNNGMVNPNSGMVNPNSGMVNPNSSNSNKRVFPLHTGYFLFAATQFFKRFILKKKQQQMLQGELRYRDFFFDAFMDLCRVQDHAHFVQRTQYWAENIFGVHASQLLLLDQGAFLVWEAEARNFRRARATLGLAGLTASQKQSSIVMNCKSNNNFHHEVDLDTVFPVYLIPIFKTVDPKQIPNAQNSETAAVLQIALNARALIKNSDMKDYIEIQNYFKPSECVEIMASHYATAVSQAYYFFEMKQNFTVPLNNNRVNNSGREGSDDIKEN